MGEELYERTIHNHREAILESLSMNNLLNESSDMRDRILFEKIPSSQKWLPVIVNAMRDGKAVEITYQSFWRDEPNTFVLHPYCLKLFRQRWYLLGRNEEYNQPRIYALDERMGYVRQLTKKAAVPKRFWSHVGFQRSGLSSGRKEKGARFFPLP